MIESDTIEDFSASAVEEAVAEPIEAAAPARTSIQSIGLVLVCTIIGAAAQIFLRYGADHLTAAGLQGILTNWALMAGYVCLGANTGLLVLALRGGQLSVLYPIIALTYVWVTILSPIFFGDTVNVYKIGGVVLIVLGVSFIGAGSRS